MVHLDKYIKELLFQYDCVVIPNFGGFVCSFKPAEIHPVQHRFHPPGKKISFNKMLVKNDGLLAHHIAISKGITYNESLVQITDEINTWIETLKLGKPIELVGIGKIFNDQVGNTQFHYEPDYNFLIDAYGLTSFQSLPIDRNQKMRIAYQKEIEPEVDLKTLTGITKMAKYSIAAALLSIAVLTSYKLQMMPDLNLNKISMNPFNSEKAIYNSISYPEIDFNLDRTGVTLKEKIENTDEASINYKVEIDGITNELKVTLKDEVIVEEAKTEKVSFGKYHVVGGCFGVESNAEKFVRSLQTKGYPADMSVIHNGLHVVSYQSFNNKSEAREFLKKIKKEHNTQAWLLVK